MCWTDDGAVACVHGHRIATPTTEREKKKFVFNPENEKEVLLLLSPI